MPGSDGVRRIVLAAMGALALAGCEGDIGGMVGVPTGVSWRGRLDEGNVVAAGIGARSARAGDLLATVDWILDQRPMPDAPELDFYWGVGLRAASEAFGPRVPVGLLWAFEGPDGHVFLEIAPGVNLAGPQFTFDGALGVRFSF